MPVRENYYRDRYRSRRAAGICCKCNSPAYGGTAHCYKHLTYMRLRNRKRKGFKPWHPGGPGWVPTECR